MRITPIRTKADHKRALNIISKLMDDHRNKEASDTLEVMTILVEKYESEHFQISAPTPIEAIRFRMEQEGLKAKDLVPYFGSKAKVSLVLSGKSPLTLKNARTLHKQLHIPAEILIA